MRTRLLILQGAGHSVAQATDLREVTKACERSQFSVIVLGQSLALPEKLRITDVVRKHCLDAKILELHGSIKSEMPDDADSALSANGLDFAQELVNAVNRLAAEKKERGL